MTNYLAAELRGILADLDDDTRLDLVHDRVQRLAEHVEQLTTEHGDPDEWVLVQRKQLTAAATVTGELDLTAAGLEPDQEIRARALAQAIDLAVCEISLPSTQLGEVLDIADRFATWIRSGERSS